jgi:hypothetical protein
VGISYHPWSRWTFRGGYGLFYQHWVRIGSESVLALNPPNLIDLSLSQGLGSTTPVFLLRNGFPASQFSPSLVSLPKLQIRAQDPNERTPYVHQVSFGPQFEISKSTVLEVTYVGNFGRKENRLRNANQGMITGYDPSGKPIVVFPYAALNTGNTLSDQHAYLELATNDGNLNYNGLLVSLRKRFSNGLSYQLSYTWSHNISDYVDNLTGGSTPEYAYNYSLERSNSPFDQTHRFVAFATYNLPVGKGGYVLNNDSVASKVLGGWQVNGIVTAETGTPFTVTAPDNTQTGGNHQSRANCIGDPYQGATSDPSLFTGPSATGRYLNPAAFAIPGPGILGNCAPRAFHGPGVQNVDLSLFKNFAITEAMRIEFRAEAFNAFNHANFQNPSANIAPSSIGSFGRSFSTVTDPRELQLALKFYF